MTICIAAICQDITGGEQVVFGASDRMVTSGDTEFEKPTTKLVNLTNSIVAMTAGDSALQIEIIRDLIVTLESRDDAKTTNPWSVKDVADLYVNFFNRAKTKRSESAILAPLRLDHNSFIERQKVMLPEFISKITRELLFYEMPPVSTIFAGVDNEKGGAHIYVVDDGDVSCHDSIGYACIGIGGRHAASQFMLARHAWTAPLPDTVLLTYIAKKRAEIAPGVGQDTDMFMIGPEIGNYIQLADYVLDELSRIYSKISKIEEGTLIAGRKEIRSYVKNLVETASKESTSSPDVGDKAPPDGGKVQVDSTKG